MYIKKPLGIFFGLIFLSFVVVQYNDPDPAIWMVIYGIAALLGFLSAFNKVPVLVLLAATVLYIAGGVYMWPVHFEGVSIGGGNISNVEEARESLGLFLCSLSFLSYVVLSKMRQHPAKGV